MQLLFSFPEPLELQFLDAQCKLSMRHSIAVRAIFGMLGVAAAVLFFLLNKLPNRVRFGSQRLPGFNPSVSCLVGNIKEVPAALA